ncbi:MAG: hypothetical protein E6H08_20585, partial [Bacteroidetes bacterium]
MKSIVNLSVLVFLICMMLLISCKKEKAYSTNLSAARQDSLLSTSPQDSLTGREFIFNELVWAYDVDGGGNLYIGVENRPELFGNNNRSVEVSVKPDSSNTWTTIEKLLYPNSSEFV